MSIFDFESKIDGVPISEVVKSKQVNKEGLKFKEVINKKYVTCPNCGKKAKVTKKPRTIAIGITLAFMICDFMKYKMEVATSNIFTEAFISASFMGEEIANIIIGGIAISIIQGVCRYKVICHNDDCRRTYMLDNKEYSTLLEDENNRILNNK